jgi:hypothetical protein
MIDFPMQVVLTISEVREQKVPFCSFFFTNGGRQFLAVLIVAASLAASRRWGVALPARPLAPTRTPVRRVHRGHFRSKFRA